MSKVLEFNTDHMGVSQVHINTEKGARYFEGVKGSVEYFEITAEQGMQPNLQHPTSKPKDNDLFERVLSSSGLVAATWSVSNPKEKVLLILTKFDFSEILYKAKHGGIDMIKDILERLNGGNQSRLLYNLFREEELVCIPVNGTY